MFCVNLMLFLFGFLKRNKKLNWINRPLPPEERKTRETERVKPICKERTVSIGAAFASSPNIFDRRARHLTFIFFLQPLRHTSNSLFSIKRKRGTKSETRAKRSLPNRQRLALEKKERKKSHRQPNLKTRQLIKIMSIIRTNKFGGR